MAKRIVRHLDLECLIRAYEARPISNARTKAWCWLAEKDAVSFDGAAIVVPSATWDKTNYLTTATSCTCDARKPCWHQEAAKIVTDALLEAALNEPETPHNAPKAQHSPGYTNALDSLLECF